MGGDKVEVEETERSGRGGEKIDNDKFFHMCKEVKRFLFDIEKSVVGACVCVCVCREKRLNS